MHALLVDFREHWLVYASMPVIAAVIGYVTKRVAIEMMFRPIEFVGIPNTKIGWQGVLPANARRMATIAMDLLMNRLVNPKEIFGRLDPDEIARELEKPLLETVDDITRDVLERYEPNIWEVLPRGAQTLLIKRVQAQAPKVIKTLTRELRSDIEAVIDVREMAINACTRDKRLLNRLMKEAGGPEFRFIARSGIYFGLIIGVIQMFTWALTKEELIMPIFGFFVGFITDWLALKLIFLPREPVRFLGITFQGKFQKRRAQVAADYGRLISSEVLTVHNVLEAAITGPRSDKLFTMIQRLVQQTIDEQASLAKPFLVLATGTESYRQLKREAAEQVMAKVPDTIRHIEGYATATLDVQGTIVRGMSQLDSIEYEGLLRPAFKQDEWKLILVGAVIGGVVGELQTLLVTNAA